MAKGLTRITESVRGREAAVGTRIVDSAYLGNGDGLVPVPGQESFRIAYYWQAAEGGKRVVGTAVMARGLTYENIDPAALITVDLGYIANDPRLHILGENTTSGTASLGGLTLIEQKANAAGYPSVDRFATLRLNPTDETTQSVMVDLPYVYTRPSDRLMYLLTENILDLSGFITALTAGQHQVVWVCVDYETGTMVGVGGTASAAQGTLPSRNEFTEDDIGGITVSNSYKRVAPVYLYKDQVTVEEADIFRQWDARLDYPLGSGGGAGTVTSVSATANPTSVFDISVTNPTTTPAIALSMDNQNEKTFLAGPASGAAAQPAFRAIASADLTVALSVPPNIGGTTPAAGTFGVFQADSIRLSAPNTVVLSSDAFSWSQSYTLVDAQTGSADDLSTISNGVTGRVLTIQPLAGDTITVKHSVGNIKLSAGADYVLSGVMALMLVYDGTQWVDVTLQGINILTTKGDLLTRTSSGIVRKAVGSNGFATVARSSVSEGWEWQRRPPAEQPARLSYSSTIPVTTSDVTAAVNIYSHPFGGGAIELYDTTDSAWIPIAFTSAASIAVPSTLFRLFDIFTYNNAGTPALELVNWNQTTGSITGATGSGAAMVITSNSHGLSNGDLVGTASMGGNTAANGKIANVINVTTNTFELDGYIGNGTYTSGGTWYKIPNTRATALATQDGRYVKSGDATRLLIGTGMTTGTSGQSEDSLLNRLLWNNYNRRERKLKAIEAANSWSYTTLAFRAWNNSVANRVIFVRGVNEDPVSMFMSGLHAVTGAASGTCGVGIGLDRTTASDADIMSASNSTGTILTVATAEYKGTPGEGFHFLQLEELSTGAAANFYGDIGDATKYQYGGIGSLMG